MTLTVRDVLDLHAESLTLLAGHAGVDRAIRWTAVSDLPDPVPWLQGADLLLTTGGGLPDDDAGRAAYVRHVADAGCVALGLALGHTVFEVPPGMVAAADVCELPFFVIDWPTKFVAISETVGERLAAQRLEATRRLVDGQRAISLAAARGGAPALVHTLGGVTGAKILVLGPHGDVLHASDRAARRRLAEVRSVLDACRAEGRFSVTQHIGDHRIIAQTSGPHGHHVLAAVLDHKPHETDTVLLNHAACLLDFERIVGDRAAARVENLRGSLAELLLTGEMGAEQASTLAARLGLPPDRPYEVALITAAVPPDDLLSTVISETAGHDGAVLRAEDGVLLIATDTDPPLGRTVTETLTDHGVLPRTVSARARTIADLPKAYETATAIHRTRPPAPYTHADHAGAIALLRHSTEPWLHDRLTATVLAGLASYDDRHHTDLTGTLATYFACGEQAEQAARHLGIHRNTMRQRLDRIEHVTGRSLHDNRDRLELWLATELAPRPHGDGVPNRRPGGNH